MDKKPFFENVFKSVTGFLTKKSWTGLLERSYIKGGVNWDKKSFLKANEISLYLNRAIAIRAQKAGQIQFTLHRGDTKLEEHPYLDLLDKPNRFMSGDTFWGLFQKYKDLCGSAYIWKEYDTDRVFARDKSRVPSALHLIRPDLVKPEIGIDEKGKIGILYFEVDTDKGKKKYQTDEIIYDYYPDPLNPLLGVSLVKAGAMAIDTEIQIDNLQNSIIKNGGKIDTVFTFKTPRLTKEQLEGLKSDYKEQRGGSENANDPLFLGGDTEIKRLGLTPEELSYMESRKMTLTDICILTGVPESLLSSMNDVKYSNSEESQRVFLRDTIKPLYDSLKTNLDWRLIPDDLDLGYIDPTPEDVDKKISIIRAAHDTNSVTINEKRRMFSELLNEEMPPIKGGAADEILVPFSVMPLGSGDNSPSDDSQKGIKKKEFTSFFSDEKIKNKYVDITLQRLDKKSNHLQEGADRFFAGQKRRTIKRLKEEFTKSVVGRKKDLRSQMRRIFDMEEEGKIAIEFILPYITEFLTESGKAELLMLDPDKEFIQSARVLNFIKKRSRDFAREVNSYTLRGLEATLSEGIEASEGISSLSKRVADKFGEYQTYRSERIARTEATAANNEGFVEAFKQTDAVKGKEWIATMDNRTRPEHAKLNGQIVGLNEKFSNGLAYPQEPNCRCVLGPALEVPKR